MALALARAVTQTGATRLLRDRLGVGRVLYGDIAHDLTLVAEPFLGPDELVVGGGRWELGAWWPPDAHERFGRGVPLACGDVAREDSIPAPTRAAYAAWEVAALVNAPVVEDGGLVAVVVVHDPAPRGWTGEEIGLVARTAGDVWQALRRLRETAG